MREFLLKKIYLRLLKESLESNTDLAVLVYTLSDKKPIAVLYNPADLLDNLDDVLDPDQRTRIFEDYGVADIIKGVVSVRPIHKVHGHCHGSWQINYIAGPGQGKILYPIAHALCPNGLLTPDRKDVSSWASDSWEKSLKLGRNRLPFDDIKNPETPPIEDDCRIDYERSHLNWAYEMAGGERELLASLMARHKETMSKISPDIISQVEDILKEEGDIFADKHLATSGI